MYVFYVLQDEQWQWRLDVHPFMLQDAQKMMDSIYGKNVVRREFKEIGA